VLFGEEICISDLGLSILESEADDLKETIGVIPYMAPELLSSGKYTKYSKATDIYAFGMIMWEITSGEMPFFGNLTNQELALRICQGVRPTITVDTPEFYCDLMQRCWDSDPTKRPTAKEIQKQTYYWEKQPEQDIQDQLFKAEEIRMANISIKNSQAPYLTSIFTSRLTCNNIEGMESF